jgi:hypothetical protein
MHAAVSAWPPDDPEVALTESLAPCHRYRDEGKYISAEAYTPSQTLNDCGDN